MDSVYNASRLHGCCQRASRGYQHGFPGLSTLLCPVIHTVVPGYPHSHQWFSSLCSKYLVNALREIINSFVSMCKYNNFCPNRLFLWVKNNFSLDLLTAFPCLCIMLGRGVGLFLRLWISALLSTPQCEYLDREMFCPRFLYLSLSVLTVLLCNGYCSGLLP